MRLRLGGPGALVAIGVAGALSLGACGGDGEEPLTRAGFVARANEICAGTQKAIDDAADTSFPNKGQVPTPDELQAFADDVVVPRLHNELDELDDLEPPKDDRERVDDMIKAGREASERISEVPALLGSKDRNPLNQYAELASAYGLKACGRISDKTTRAITGLD